MIYWLFLPTLPADPRPSTTIMTAFVLALLLSLQLSLLQTHFSQQSKDAALISKEVLHEYDTKYVRPRTQPLYRDVGTQFSERASYGSGRDEQYNTVETHTPMVVINRGFQTNPNPNYTKYTDPDGVTTKTSGLRHRTSTPNFKTPAQIFEPSSPARALTAIRQPTFRPTSGDGGSLGVYSHAASPLRKSASTNFSRHQQLNGHHAERETLSPEKRPQSPEKRMSTPSAGMSTLAASQRWGHLKPDRSRRETGRF